MDDGGPRRGTSRGSHVVAETETATRLAHKAMSATGSRSIRPLHWAVLLAAGALLPLIIYAALSALHSDDVVLTVPITRKSIADRSDYMGLHLRNGMKVLLSSNPETPTGVAMICVMVGSMTDPEEIQGLAHFTEHMLFMGSKKYPSEGALKTFVYGHGGNYNGFTKDDSTCYYFSVEADYLEGAVEILSDMFKQPLIQQSSSKREVHAVDTEYRRGLKTDYWRNLQIDKLTSDQTHDYHKFSVGNQKTLDEGATKMNSTLAREATKFFHKYYSAGIMNLGLHGKQPLSELKRMAVSNFADVQDKGIPPANWDYHPFKRSNRKLIKRMSDTEGHSLSLSFPMHDISKQLYPLKTLLEHKDKGGLHRYLITKGWMRSSSSQTKCIRGFCIFTTSFDLTDSGFNHWQDVVSHFFSYINFLKTHPLPDHYLQELDEILKIDYRFTSSFSLITQVQVMEKYNLSDLASAPYLLLDYEPHWIDEILHKLNPNNMRLMISSARFNGSTDRLEPLYSTEFSIEDLSQSSLDDWKTSTEGQNGYFYPPKNNWIPHNFSIHEKDEDWHAVPKLLVDDDRVRLWYFQDTSFNSPRSKAEIYLRTNAIREDRSRMGVSLVEDCFKRSIEEEAYGPAIGGLTAYFQSDIGGFRITVQGYNERLPELANLVLKNFMTFQLTEECFTLSKKSWLKNLKESERSSSSLHSFIRGRLIYHELSRRWRERETAMIRCTLPEARDLLNRIRRKLAAEVYVYGNIVQSDAYSVLNATKELLSVSEARLDDLKSLAEHSMKRGTINRLREHFDEQTLNSVYVYYEIGRREQTRNLVLTELFVNAIAAETSNVLRGRQQLGYSVGVVHERRSKTHGVAVYVESGSNTSFVESRIQDFVKRHVTTFLTDMSEETFQQHLTALVTKKRTKPKNVYESGDRFTAEIIDGNLLFNRTEIEAISAEVLTKADLITLHRRYMLNPTSSKALITLIESGPEREGDGKVETVRYDGSRTTFDTIEDYKKTLPLIEW
ncbi:insulin-degrading enzyme [Galendromus occidentalis]|uniref:Insulin-degrading enzyme n=1 Tax=Galendromus occidentalis TaxID=34638 RepID=A0AAJ6QWR2_9ACAR|nr:insulin-degrading enzyme [Galendromus occidentalis]